MKLIRTSTQRRRHRRSNARYGARPLRLEWLEDRRLLAGVQLTPHEQLLIELINRARLNPDLEARRYGIELNDNLEPGTISADPKQPLAPNDMLVIASRLHSEDMLNFDFFSHTNLKGEEPQDRATKAGYPGNAGENIAWFGQAFPLNQEQQVYLRHESLFRSEGHRENMLAPQYHDVGVGVRMGTFENLNAIMVTEMFGVRTSNAAITGVAYSDHVAEDSFYTIGEGLRRIEVVAVNNETGEEYRTLTADAGGYALEVPDGTYTVTATGSGIGEPMTFNNVVVEGENVKVDFNARTRGKGGIIGLVFRDANGNGVRDFFEGVLSGWTVFLDQNENGFRDNEDPQVETGDDGIYEFVDLENGTYQVGIVPKPGWHALSPEEIPASVEVVRGETVLGALFGMLDNNKPPIAGNDNVTIRGAPWVELDVKLNDTDPEGRIDPFSLKVVDQPVNGRAVTMLFGSLIRYTPNEGFFGEDEFTYTIQDAEGTVSAPATVKIKVEPRPAWQNPDNRFDVDGDGVVAPLDALRVLTEMNQGGLRQLATPDGSSSPPPYVDVSGDGFLSPVDAMQVLNELNRLSRQSAAPPPQPVETAESDPPEESHVLTAELVDLAMALDVRKSVAKDLGDRITGEIE